ncbi:RING finger protein 32 [Osmerus mordax]|uniref:RING finger protein 32 n=1 Tax=Osmerus mordax TaxID=8014 RepID=UPI003510AB43
MTMRKGLTSRTTSGRVAINSVALQDHISRNLLLQNLSLCDPVKSRRLRKALTETRCKKQCDSGMKAKCSQQQGAEEIEYVLDPAQPALTLAQKLGLVDAPAQRLTVDEWSRVKARSVDEGDSAQPCVICREEFRLQAQVLLSCSHVFHRVCLQAFESFAGRKCCPMCRKAQYETRVIHDGARLFRERCATRIQTCWRGYVARKWYRNMRKTIPPKDKHLRRRYFEEKLRELNDSFVQSCHTDIEDFLSEIDQSVTACRRVFGRFERENISEVHEEEWIRIQNKVLQRDIRDCSICLTPLCSPNLGMVASITPPPGRRRSVLLSCSHLFHQPCLEAFESFCLEETPTCPMCRSHYQKHLV